MPNPTYPRDRFDDLADETGRVGAHRSENPRLRGGVILLWAVVATIVLVAAGIFGSLVVSGRIALFPTTAPTAASLPEVAPVVDTTSTVIVLNASGQQGLATQTKDVLVTAGWNAESVLPGDAGGSFETTTVYYSQTDDEAAALGVADVIGGAQVAQSSQYDAYPVEDNPATEADETQAVRLVVVIGTDRVTGATPAS